MPPVMDEGLCIRHWDWSETSQTVSVFTRSHGVVRALAKGSRRPKGAFGGGIELLTRGRLGVIVRPSTELALLTEWDLAETFPRLGRQLRAHRAGLHVADLIHHLVIDRDPHEGLYDAAVAALRGIDAGHVEVALLRIQFDTLAHCGYRPRLSLTNGASADALSFDPALGGVVPREAAGPDAGRAWGVRPETLALLREVDAGTPIDALAAREAGVVDRANRLLAAYVRYLLDAQMPTTPLLFADLPGPSATPRR